MDMDLRTGIPDGMVLVKKGGRPKSDSRNIAIFMNRLWRTEILGESVKAADSWILEHWKNRNGITEESTIRRAIRAAKSGPLRDAIMYRVYDRFNPAKGEFVFDSNVPAKFQIFDNEPLNGSTVWIWTERGKTAFSYVLEAPQFEIVEVSSFD